MSQVHDEMRNMTMANFYKADLVDGDMWNDDGDEDGDDNDEYDGDGDAQWAPRRGVKVFG